MRVRPLKKRPMTRKKNRSAIRSLSPVLSVFGAAREDLEGEAMLVKDGDVPGNVA